MDMDIYHGDLTNIITFHGMGYIVVYIYIPYIRIENCWYRSDMVLYYRMSIPIILYILYIPKIVLMGQ